MPTYNKQVKDLSSADSSGIHQRRVYEHRLFKMGDYRIMIAHAMLKFDILRPGDTDYCRSQTSPSSSKTGSAEKLIHGQVGRNTTRSVMR